jgi:hypothetical protein
MRNKKNVEAVIIVTSTALVAMVVILLFNLVLKEKEEPDLNSQVRFVTLENNLECLVYVKDYRNTGISCNWDKFNSKELINAKGVQIE